MVTQNSSGKIYHTQSAPQSESTVDNKTLNSASADTAQLLSTKEEKNNALSLQTADAVDINSQYWPKQVVSASGALNCELTRLLLSTQDSQHEIFSSRGQLLDANFQLIQSELTPLLYARPHSNKDSSLTKAHSLSHPKSKLAYLHLRPQEHTAALLASLQEPLSLQQTNLTTPHEPHADFGLLSNLVPMLSSQQSYFQILQQAPEFKTYAVHVAADNTAHAQVTITTNLIDQAELASVCAQHNLPLTNLQEHFTGQIELKSTSQSLLEPGDLAAWSQFTQSKLTQAPTSQGESQPTSVPSLESMNLFSLRGQGDYTVVNKIAINHGASFLLHSGHTLPSCPYFEVSCSQAHSKTTQETIHTESTFAPWSVYHVPNYTYHHLVQTYDYGDLQVLTPDLSNYLLDILTQDDSLSLAQLGITGCWCADNKQGTRAKGCQHCNIGAVPCPRAKSTEHGASLGLRSSRSTTTQAAHVTATANANPNMRKPYQQSVFSIKSLPDIQAIEHLQATGSLNRLQQESGCCDETAHAHNLPSLRKSQVKMT